MPQQPTNLLPLPEDAWVQFAAAAIAAIIRNRRAETDGRMLQMRHEDAANEAGQYADCMTAEYERRLRTKEGL